MYIEKYWGNYIGGTDDSLTLLECSVNGSVSLRKLPADEDGDNVRITFTEEEKTL